jgi:hypothetical protein
VTARRCELGIVSASLWQRQTRNSVQHRLGTSRHIEFVCWGKCRGSPRQLQPINLVFLAGYGLKVAPRASRMTLTATIPCERKRAESGSERTLRWSAFRRQPNDEGGACGIRRHAGARPFRRCAGGARPGRPFGLSRSAVSDSNDSEQRCPGDLGLVRRIMLFTTQAPGT